MYAGGWIVKKKCLPPITANVVVLDRHVFVILDPCSLTSLDFWHRLALLNLLPQHFKSICVLRRPHGR